MKTVRKLFGTNGTNFPTFFRLLLIHQTTSIGPTLHASDTLLQHFKIPFVNFVCLFALHFFSLLFVFSATRWTTHTPKKLLEHIDALQRRTCWKQHSAHGKLFSEDACKSTSYCLRNPFELDSTLIRKWAMHTNLAHPDNDELNE